MRVTALRSVVAVLAGELASLASLVLFAPVGRHAGVCAGGSATRSVVAAPVLLVPGLVTHPAMFTDLAGALHRQGHPVRVARGGALTAEIRSAAVALGEQVAELRAATGASRVHLVGYSLGGLVARYYVQRLGGHVHVDTLVTIATPHGGTQAARLLGPLPLAGQLRPDSELLAELGAPAPECTTRIVAYYSDADEVVLPCDHGRVQHGDLHVRNHPVSGVGHLAMPGHERVVQSITTALASVGGDDREKQRTLTARAHRGSR